MNSHTLDPEHIDGNQPHTVIYTQTAHYLHDTRLHVLCDVNILIFEHIHEVDGFK
jgi:hypothetical protein